MLLTEYQHRTRSAPTQTAAAQLRTWVESKGQDIWQKASTLPDVERVCHALDNTHAVVYGLLVTPNFFTIFSTLHLQAFTRLADRYEAAVRTGLCFWWDGSTLRHCVHIDTFFARIQTLPPPR